MSVYHKYVIYRKFNENVERTQNVSTLLEAVLSLVLSFDTS